MWGWVSKIVFKKLEKLTIFPYNFSVYKAPIFPSQCLKMNIWFVGLRTWRWCKPDVRREPNLSRTRTEKIESGEQSNTRHCQKPRGNYLKGSVYPEHDLYLAEPLLRNYSLEIICRYQKLRSQCRLAESWRKENIFMLNKFR